MSERWLNTLSYVSERLVPDAVTTSGLLLVAITLIAAATGGTAIGITEAYYKGLWMLLTFTMQMTLVLLLSLMLASAPAVRGFIVRCAELPRNTTQVVIGAGVLGACVAYLNWGLGLALGPMIAIHFARNAERKGIPVDFLFLMAMMAGVGSVWQFGLSASAPLLSATEGHFLEKSTGVMSLATTIWAPASVILVITFTTAAIATGCLLMPRKCKPLSAFPESNTRAEDLIGGATGAGLHEDLSLSQRMERSWWAGAPLWLALAGWLWFHFFIRNSSFDINSMVTTLLLACFVFHGNVHRFTKALQEAVGSVWPVLLLSAQRGMLALSVGDHMGNLISPFWAVVGAGVARLDFRLFFGYRLIFAALWFVMGVLAFTFLPC
jgi:short-chain fatty acids transporter